MRALGPLSGASVPTAPPVYDAVVIGTGMGGATIGLRLAQLGHRVLFLEKGGAEAQPAVEDDLAEDPDSRMRAGRWPGPIDLRIDGVSSSQYLPLGCGAGGSTLFYAAALERMDAVDMQGAGATWPVPWQRWTRYYAAAESLFGVAGMPDPLGSHLDERLAPPPLASDADEMLMRDFERCGLHPYRLHVAVSYRAGCGECGGIACQQRCKGDARRICIEPALATGRARLETHCEVSRIHVSGDRVSRVSYMCDGMLRSVGARIVILAAGAYHSPALLLRSTSREWPQGLGNKAGLVGRFLMFHANEWFAVWPRRRASDAGPRKTIGFRDLAIRQGRRLGSVQSTGLSASFGNIYGMLRQRWAGSAFRKLPLVGPALKLAALLATKILGRATTFVMLVEDFAYAGNRVMLHPDDPDRIQVVYDIPKELRDRAAFGRRAVRAALRGLRVMPLQTEVQLNYGHPCGTCRFGDDPATSVLDASCRVHGIDNLYVVDASFMPSSGGVNPALTIAANALRVGDIVGARLLADRSGQEPQHAVLS